MDVRSSAKKELRANVKACINRHTRWSLVAGNLVMYMGLTFSWVSSHAVRLEIAGSGDESGSIIGTLRELVQPLRW
jgi:hypothetical protein